MTETGADVQVVTTLGRPSFWDAGMQRRARRSLAAAIGPGWEIRNPVGIDPAGWLVALANLRLRLSVLASVACWDGVDWLHASIAHQDRDPTYAELKALHAAVFGDRFAFQAFVPADRHVNIHSHALHLYGRVDGVNPLPDFGAFGSI